MPANAVVINNATEYIVVDSEMDAVIDYLDKHSVSKTSPDAVAPKEDEATNRKGE